MTPKEYDLFLSKFKVKVIQAHYTWHRYHETEDFQNMGYQIDSVMPTDPYNQEENFVFTKIQH